MSKIIIEHVPSVKLYKIGCDEFRTKLVNAWAWKKIDLEDTWYFYPLWEDWDKIFLYVQKNLPKYCSDTFDCDNFSIYVSVMVAKNFKCNTCARVEGYMSGERHKWNVFFDGDGFYQLESQKYTPPNTIADLDDPNYVPDEIEVG